MIEERGRVVAVEAGAVWVATVRKSTCSSCSAQKGCGQGLLDNLGLGSRRGFVRALSNLPVGVGDSVVIGVREDLLVRGSMLVYLLPLLGLFAGALLARQFSTAEPLIIFFSLSGFALAWLAVRWRSRLVSDEPALQPVVLRAVLATDS